jgi:hypothetical protein
MVVPTATITAFNLRISGICGSITDHGTPRRGERQRNGVQRCIHTAFSEAVSALPWNVEQGRIKNGRNRGRMCARNG